MSANLSLAVAVAVVWLAASALAFVNGLARQFHVWQWLALSLALGPLALVLSLFLTGSGYKTSLFGRRAVEPTEPGRLAFSDDELLSGEKTAFKHEIIELTRAGKLQDAERMLETLIDVVEEKARKLDRGVPHWYYEQLALVYRKQKREKAEARVLERWARLPHASAPRAEARLVRRLRKLES